ncbi:dihydroneopterin aldolase, partial [Stenotrophomonas maltophilia]
MAKRSHAAVFKACTSRGSLPMQNVSADELAT